MVGLVRVESSNEPFSLVHLLECRNEGGLKHVQFPLESNLLLKDERAPEMVAGLQEAGRQIAADVGGHVQEQHALCLEGAAHRDLRPELIDRPAQASCGVWLSTSSARPASFSRVSIKSLYNGESSISGRNRASSSIIV